MMPVYVLEVEEDEDAYIVKVGMILVFSSLQIITDDEYFNLSCSYTGVKIGPRIHKM
jgi:hypothetical protein